MAIVTQDDYPSIGEVRPRKLAKSLHQAGHVVIFMGWNSRQKPEEEELGYAKVYRFNYLLNSKLYGLLSSPSPLNPLWVSWIRQVGRQERPDVLIASNLRVALPAIVAAKTLGIPIVLDLQENNPEAVKLYPKTRLWHYVVRNSTLVGTLERLCIRFADHVWVVVQERLLEIAPRLRRGGKVSVLHHTPELEKTQFSSRKGSTRDGVFTLVFIGLFTPGVDSLELILRSLPCALQKDRNLRLLIGGGREWQPLVQQLGIDDHVVFAGIIEPEKVSAWLQQGDLGVIAYDVNRFTNTTVSHKLFQYMGAGLPVLSTAMAPTQRILHEVGCGVTLPLGASPSEVAEIILRLKSSPDELANMGRRAQQAIRENYNWSRDFDHAMQSLRQVISRKRRAD